MILIHCPACRQNFRLLQDDALVGTQSEFWPDKYRCPSCGNPCAAHPEGSEYSVFPTRDLEPVELYAAMHGLGLPGEMMCDAETVREVLAKGVTKVAGFVIPGTTRFVIEHVVVADGTRMFLAACPHGAVVYRIARRPGYAEKVLEESNG